MIFLKSNQVKFDQIFRKIYQQMWYFVDTIWEYIFYYLSNDIDIVFCMLMILGKNLVKLDFLKTVYGWSFGMEVLDSLKVLGVS
jgi:hypothetical protein